MVQIRVIMDRVVLTKEEHLNYRHLCGRTGAEVELMGDLCFTICEILRDCLLDHCLKPLDLLSDIELEISVDRLMKWVMHTRKKGG